eukprot:TRINITY_DN20519_c0_g1_i1.p1 TRINITY_DN20519_c0_g1~~TRINITY_DN20519_c0_g1_i1.p1  ORF type:complete len:509 (+),score=98.29 TRINITY_DN20519_c0_g1_i1:74-1528(+)
MPSRTCPPTREAESSVPPTLVTPALQTAAKQGAVKRSNHKRSAAGRGGRTSSKKVTSQLTAYHPTVKHLYVCERNHCWQWVQDHRLAALWQELDKKERWRVVRTHDGRRPCPRFCKELEAQLWSHNCKASNAAKKGLASVILCDTSSLSLYKEIFLVAVGENVPMLIDMEVVASVDSVVQDFRAELAERAPPPKFSTMALVFFFVMLFGSWYSGSIIAWLVFFIITSVAISRKFGNVRLDPRTFKQGSDLWVQYREREHVRLMWMSAMVRVFELRLLRLWESRRRAAKRQAKQSEITTDKVNTTGRQPRRLPTCTDGATSFFEHDGLVDLGREDSQAAGTRRKKLLGPRRLERQRRRDGSSQDSKPQVPGVGGEGESEEQPTSLEMQLAAVEEKQERLDVRDDHGARFGTFDFEESDDELEGEFCGEGGDEIDAEFARRVREHLQDREKAASKWSHSQTERGNQIIKALCQKLKEECERSAQLS